MEIYPVREQCRDFQDAIDLYKASYGAYPPESNALTFIVGDQNCRKLLKSTNLLDPWGTPYRVRIRDGHAYVDSAGKDRKFDSSDDIHAF
jgi:hypothetical protein